MLIRELRDFKGRCSFDACYLALLDLSQADIRPSEPVSPLSIQSPVVQILTTPAPESTVYTINPKLLASEHGTAGTGKEVMNISTEATAAQLNEHTTTEMADWAPGHNATSFGRRQIIADVAEVSQVSASHPTACPSPPGETNFSPLIAWMELPADPYLGNEAENTFQDILAANEDLF